MNGLVPPGEAPGAARASRRLVADRGHWGRASGGRTRGRGM